MRPVLLPKSLEDLWVCIKKYPEASLYAGGTDLLVHIQRKICDPKALICLERIRELKGVEETQDCVKIRACNTLAFLADHDLIFKYFPILTKSIKTLGSPLIRRMGTLGGNICNASPAGDTLPALYVLNAQVELRSSEGHRIVPISELISGPGKTCLQPGEILSAVILPKSRKFDFHHFEKTGLRKSLACSVVSMAALLRFTQNGVVTAACFAWGSVGPTIITSEEAEKRLIGEKPTPAVLEHAAEAVRKDVCPIDDLRAHGAYRRQVAGNLLLRLAGTSLGDLKPVNKYEKI